MNDLGYVTDFLRELADNVSYDVQLESVGLWSSRADEGSVYLNGEDHWRYKEVLLRLVKDFAKKEDISSRTIARELQTAIFEVLDIPEKRRSQTLEERLQTSVNALRQALKAPSRTYRCFVPIAGLEASELPFRFGGLRFVTFNNSQLRKFLNATKYHTKQSEKRKSVRKEFRRLSIWNKPCGFLEVPAKDQNAAISLARRETSLTLDALNFFWDLVPYNLGWLYLPEEASTALLDHPLLGEDYSFAVPSVWKGPLTCFSVSRFRNEPRLQSAKDAVGSLLKNAPPKSTRRLLLTAIQWAGRASIEPRRERAFVQYMIALESAFLPSGDGELSYRLRIRVARLLGRDLASRKQISQDFSRLYGIRSRIVHDGSYEVTEIELDRLKTLTKSALLRLLRHRSVRKCQSKSDLEDWFNNMVLR